MFAVGRLQQKSAHQQSRSASDLARLIPIPVMVFHLVLSTDVGIHDLALVLAQVGAVVIIVAVAVGPDPMNVVIIIVAVDIHLHGHAVGPVLMIERADVVAAVVPDPMNAVIVMLIVDLIRNDRCLPAGSVPGNPC